MANILVSTFGATWAVGAELIAFAAYPKVKVLGNNKSIQSFHNTHLSNGDQIDEVWLICTHGIMTNNAIAILKKWIAHFDLSKMPQIRFLSLKGLEDLTTPEETVYMADFIYRIVLKAKNYTKGGKLFLSLAGGRKTMSSDMQRAADVFGCSSLFHLADNGIGKYDSKVFKHLEVEDFISPFDYNEANKLFLVEVMTNKINHFITEVEPLIDTDDYPVSFNRENLPSKNLYNLVEQRLKESESLLYNAYRIRTGKTNQSIFHGLQQLPPAKLQQLSEETPDELWLKALPKAELHYHFGGTLSTLEMIETALANEAEITHYLKTNEAFNNWYKSIKEAVQDKNDNLLRSYITNKNKLRQDTFTSEEVKPPIVVAAFIAAFESEASYLDKLIFGDYQDSNKFRNIGIVAYEQLGDLQGSALMQSKASIEKSCDLLLDYCKRENLKYIEVRCSPANYTLGGLSELDVVMIMYDKLFNNPDCEIRVILIGSRHGDENIFERHVKLATQMLNDRKLKKFIVGFDVAGDESKAKPSELREQLRPLMLESLHITIHAGENQPVSNIWEAAYDLNADRIGHGLTLVDNKKLMRRFRDRNIFVELCPSSNYQISSFGSGSKDYPLREFLEAGIKATLNTDNTGISRTTITNEYLFMTRETQLTKLEVLQLLRNSFQAVFLPKDEKKQLLLKVETELYDFILNEKTLHI